MRAASDIPFGESARFSASLDEQFLSEVEVCTPSEAEGWDRYYDAAPMGLVHPERSRVPRAKPRGGTVTMMPPQWGYCTPSGAECTPSGAEGWVYMHWISRLGFARRTVCEPSAHRAEPRFAPRAKPRGTYTHKILVSAPLDEQFKHEGNIL